MESEKDQNPEELSQRIKDLESQLSRQQALIQDLTTRSERYRLIIEHAADGIGFTNPQGFLVDVNQTVLDMTGFSRAELLNQNIKELISPAELSHRPVAMNMVQEDKPFIIERSIKHKDGSYIPIELSIRRMQDGTVQAILRDLRDRKRIQEITQQREALFLATFKENQAILLLIDPKNAKIVDCSRGACQFYGYSLDTMLSMTVFQIDIESPEQITVHIQNALNRETNFFHLHHRLSSGEIRIVEIHSNPVEVRGRPLLYTILQDITEKELAEEAYRTSESRLQRITNHMLDIVAETDANGIFRYVSPSITNVLGYDPQMLIGTSALGLIFPEDLAQIWEIFCIKENQERDYFKFEFRGVHANGEARWLECISNPLTGSKGEISGAVFSVREISDRKKIEAALLRSHEELEHRVLERTKDLASAEERYRHLIEISPDAIAINDQEGKIYLVNDQFLKLFNIPSGKESSLGNSYDYIDPNQIETINPLLDSLWECGILKNFECSMLRADGSTFIAEVSTSMVSEEKREDNRFISIVRDITGRKRSEEFLHHQLDELSLLHALASASSEEISEGVLLTKAIQLIEAKLFPPRSIGIILADAEGKWAFHPSSTIPIEVQVSFLHIDQVWLRSILAEAPSFLFKDFHTRGQKNPPPKSQSLLVVPLRSNAALLGIILVLSPQNTGFNPNDDRLLITLSWQLATALLRIRLLREERKRRDEMESILHISIALRQANGRSDLVPLILTHALSLLNAQKVALFLKDEDTIFLESASGFPSLEKFKMSTSQRDALLSLILSGNPLFSDGIHPLINFQSSALFSYLDLSLGHAMAAIPLQTTREIIGFLILAWQCAYPFSPSEKQLLLALGETAGIAIHRTSLIETLEKRSAARSRELAAVYEIASISCDTGEVGQILKRALRVTLDALSAHAGAFFIQKTTDDRLEMATRLSDERLKSLPMPDERAIVDRVFSQGMPIQARYASPALQYGASELMEVSYLAVPIRMRGRRFGVLVVNRLGENAFKGEEFSLINNIADQVGIAIENARLRQRAEQIAILEERQRLARDLHDSVTQQLYSLNILTAAAINLTRSAPQRLIPHLNLMEETAQMALKEMRQLIFELRPSILKEEGLIGALQQRLESVEKRAGIQCELITQQIIDLPSAIEAPLYYIAQEALNNALKHSTAHHITITLKRQAELLTLEIIDDGIGFDPQRIAGGGLGLPSMRDRVSQIGGELTITSVIDGGTQVKVSVDMSPFQQKMDIFETTGYASE